MPREKESDRLYVHRLKKRNMDGIAMAGIHRHQRFLDSQMFWLSFFLFAGAVMGTVFCNKMSAEMKSTLESWFSGIFTSAEMVSSDRYSLFVGVLKKRFVWILLGILICQTVFSRILFYAGAAYLAFTSSIAVCALTMHGGGYGILRFFGLIFPQGIFYALAGYLLCIIIAEPADGKERSSLWMMAVFMVLGIVSEIFINPEFSAWIFRLF